MHAFPDHRLDLGALVLQREIAVAGGMRPAKPGDFAAHPDMPIGVLHRPLQRGGQLGHREFRCVDQGLGCGHQEFSIRVFWAGPQVRDFSAASPIRACQTNNSVLQSTLNYSSPVRNIMLKSLISASVKTVRWALGAAGVLALLITALIATPLERPPELASISAARGTVDLSSLPTV